MAKPKDGGLGKCFRLFDVFSPVGVLLYAFGRRKLHSASFLNAHKYKQKSAGGKPADSFYFIQFFSTPRVTFSPLISHSFVNEPPAAVMISVARTSWQIPSLFAAKIASIFSLPLT